MKTGIPNRKEEENGANFQIVVPWTIQLSKKKAQDWLAMSVEDVWKRKLR